MHFTTATTAALAGLLATTAVASPIQSTVANDGPAAALTKRHDDTCSFNHGAGAYAAFWEWYIYINNDANYDATCGGGVLDNIRGRCGGGAAVLEWGCDIVDGGAANMHFYTPLGCTSNDIQSAVNAATRGEVTFTCNQTG